MDISKATTVAEVALAYPGTTRIFEDLGIDYCCNGNLTISQACEAANLVLDDVLHSLDEVRTSLGKSSDAPDWQTEPLTSLAVHIVDTHHFFTKMEVSRLTKLVTRVCERHSENHPELTRIQELFQELKNDLVPHMLKEEQVLFPYVARLEESAEKGEDAPIPFFGSVRHPVQAMQAEHDRAGELLKNIRRTANDFTVPDDACISYRTLYQALQEFETDLHQHIHLENNILFPRAIEFEKSRIGESDHEAEWKTEHSCSGH